MLLVAWATAAPLPDALQELSAALPEGSAAVVAEVDARGTRFTSLGEAGPDDRFEIGSITKVFNTMALLALVDEGTLRLDQPLAELLVEAPAAITLGDVAAERAAMVALKHSLCPCLSVSR